MLATSPFYFFMAHQVLTDMMLTAWMSWALYFYLAACRAPSPLWPLFGFYLCAAGGLASKGPAALMVLVAAVAASLAAGGFGALKRLKLPLGLAIIALTALPWLLPYLFQRERSYGGRVRRYSAGTSERRASRLERWGASHALIPLGFFIFPAIVVGSRADADRRRRLVGRRRDVLLSLRENAGSYFLRCGPSSRLVRMSSSAPPSGPGDRDGSARSIHT